MFFLGNTGCCVRKQVCFPLYYAAPHPPPHPPRHGNLTLRFCIQSLLPQANESITILKIWGTSATYTHKTIISFRSNLLQCNWALTVSELLRPNKNKQKNIFIDNSFLKHCFQSHTSTIILNGCVTWAFYRGFIFQAVRFKPRTVAGQEARMPPLFCLNSHLLEEIMVCWWHYKKSRSRS